MNYIFAAAWFLIGIYLIYNGIKNFRLFLFLGAYFIFLGAWWTANELLSVNLFDGIYANILRVVSAAVLLISVGVYLWLRKKRTDK